MKFKVSILGIVLALSYSMGNEFAELFSDYAFYEGYPAGIHPDRDGNPLNAYDRLHGLVKFEQDKGSSQATVLEGNYIDGEQDGVFQLKSTVYEGVVLKEETYKNGWLDGESKRWVFMPKETDTPKEYRILVRKTLEEAPAEPKPGVPSKTLKSIKLTSIGFGGAGKISETNHYCGSITLGIDDLTQGNEHHYEVTLHSQTLHKRYIERYSPSYGALAGENYNHSPFMIEADMDREYCISQYGFFETLLERFEKGEFNPFSNDSDYQVGKPFIKFNPGKEEGLIAFQSEKVKQGWLNAGRVSETINETINDATYKLKFQPDPWNIWENLIIFTKNDIKIDPRIYNQEEFNILLNKMYNKELSSFIAENLTKLKIN